MRPLIGAALLAARLAAALLPALLPAAAPARAGEPDGAVAEIARLARDLALVPPPGALEAASVEALLAELRATDPHVELLPPAAAGGAGLGLRLSTLGPRPLVMPLAGGPAAAAGLAGPAYLEAVDGRPVAGLDAAAIAALLPAPSAAVELALVAGPDGRRLALRVAAGPVPPVAVERLPGRQATLLRLHELVADRTADELARALADAEPAAPIVLDLRLNPGGALFEALDAASLLLPAGAPVAWLRERGREWTLLRAVGRRPARLEAPVVLLVSEHTASAAEALARALVHHGRALAVGRPTRGKCRAQRELSLADGRRLRLTTSALAGPDGEDCEGRPLVPSVGVAEPTLLDGEALVALALGLLGSAGRPTALCLREGLAPAAAALRSRELELLFPGLPGPVRAVPGAGGARRCIGPLADPQALAFWRRRLEAGLAAARPPVAVEPLPYGRLLSRAP